MTLAIPKQKSSDSQKLSRKQKQSLLNKYDFITKKRKVKKPNAFFRSIHNQKPNQNFNILSAENIIFKCRTQYFHNQKNTKIIVLNSENTISYNQNFRSSIILNRLLMVFWKQLRKSYKRPCLYRIPQRGNFLRFGNPKKPPSHSTFASPELVCTPARGTAMDMGSLLILTNSTLPTKVWSKQSQLQVRRLDTDKKPKIEQAEDSRPPRPLFCKNRAPRSSEWQQSLNSKDWDCPKSHIIIL